MNKEEILNKYINLIDKGYCSDCNELNCIDNFPHSKITHAIRELQQENKILKENAENNDKVVDKVNWDNMLLKKENKQLKIQISAREEVCNRLESNWNKLNKKYENAVADYEKTMFEKEQLNSLVNSCQEEIRQLKKQLEEYKKELETWKKKYGEQ